MDFFTPEMLARIKARNSQAETMLTLVANDPQKHIFTIRQLNEMFSQLPEQMRRDADFTARLASPRRDMFSGAFGEMTAAYALQRLAYDVDYEPELDGQTPDFAILTNSQKRILEVTAINPFEDELITTKNYGLISSEFAKANSRKRIIVQSKITSRDPRVAKELAQRAIEYVNSLTQIDDRVHSVFETNGHQLEFSVFEQEEIGGMSAGASFHGWRGDYTKKLLGALERKRKKYEYPIVLCCVLDIHARASIDNFLSCMIGEPQLSIQLSETGGEPLISDVNSMRGFWGSRNFSVASNKQVESLLIIKPSWQDQGFRLSISCMHNPYLEKAAHPEFKGVPDLLSYAMSEQKLPAPHFLEIEERR